MTETVPPKEHLLTFIEKIISQRFEKSTNDDINIKSVSDPDVEVTKSRFKYKITINRENGDKIDLFAKVTGLKKKIRPELKLLETERLFYNCLINTYRQLEQKHSLSEKERLKLPEFYGAKSDHGNEILVLEDISSRGFGSLNRFEPLDWAYAAAAVTELAKFHALSIAFQHESPTDFDNFTAQLQGGISQKCVAAEIGATGLIMTAMRSTRSDNKDKLLDFLHGKDFLNAANDLLKPLNGKVIVHGCFWPQNMMHKTSTDGSMEVIPLDYSMIQVGSIVTDFIHFVFTATDASFRVKHYSVLFAYYCTELARATAALGLNLGDIYPGDVLTAELTQKLPYGLYAAIVRLPQMTLDTLEDREGGVPADDAADFLLYIRRLNEVVDTCVDAGILKEQQNISKRRRICFLC